MILRDFGDRRQVDIAVVVKAAGLKSFLRLSPGHGWRRRPVAMDGRKPLSLLDLRLVAALRFSVLVGYRPVGCRCRAHYATETGRPHRATERSSPSHPLLDVSVAPGFRRGARRGRTAVLSR